MELLTVAEVAKALRLSRSKIYKMAEAGELKAVKIGASDSAWKMSTTS
jgi:excisionase family DNA binding protein